VPWVSLDLALQAARRRARIARALVGARRFEPELALLELERSGGGIADRQVHHRSGRAVARESCTFSRLARSAGFGGERSDAFVQEVSLASPRRQQQGI
jgi:hypothetical protein